MEGVLITRDREFQAEKAVVNFLTRLLLQAQTSWSCQFFTNLLFLCLKDAKGACSGHFFKPYIIEALVHKKLNFFPQCLAFLPVCALSCPTLCDPIDFVHGPFVHEFSRQEYWSELPCPSPGDLPDPGIELTFPPIVRWILYHWATREALISFIYSFVLQQSFWL